MSVPAGTVKTFIVNVASFGAVPASSRTSTISATTRISATVIPSALRRTPAARRAGTTASSRARASATPPTRKPAHDGWLFQTPIVSRNDDPKMPAADEVTRA